MPSRRSCRAWTALVGVLSVGALAGASSASAAVFGWGENVFGQVGDGSTTDRSKPVLVKGLPRSSPRVIAVAGGHAGDYSLALTADGTVWSWGRNDKGQLGDGTEVARRATARQVPGLTGVTAIAGSGGAGLALKGDGTLFAWGDNAFGQTGTGTQGGVQRTPVQVNISGVEAIAGGGGHLIALKSDGTVFGWGNNVFGAVGNGTTAVQPTPVQVLDLTDVKAIAAGGGHSLAVKSDGTVFEWGAGPPENPAIPIPQARTRPVQVAGLDDVTALAAGEDFSIALKGNGTVFSWGNNVHGELGDGTKAARLEPKRVARLTNVRAIDAAGVAAMGGPGCGHSLALRRDGTVWAWGCNRSGQLADCTTVDRTRAVQAFGLTGVSGIAASAEHSLANGRRATVTLRGAVAPRKISLRTVAGDRVTRLCAGRYTIVVRDRSARDNFHIVGPGVNRSTGIASRGRTRFRVRLRAGRRYRYRSDRPGARLTGSFRVGR
jgi:alpha-tubulin suppressor-like RCC1 family protein